jgi:iron complex outermembrane recepter protein
LPKNVQFSPIATIHPGKTELITHLIQGFAAR